jgi:hypothetical protein
MTFYCQQCGPGYRPGDDGCRHTEQLELPVLDPIVEPTYTPGLSIPERFAMFHAANPHVARALEALAAQWLIHNDRASINALFERLRWESGITTVGDAYQLNNDYRADYARLLIDRHPEWADAFRLRRRKAA